MISARYWTMGAHVGIWYNSINSRNLIEARANCILSLVLLTVYIWATVHKIRVDVVC